MKKNTQKANLRLESLENRNLMAGDVTVQVFGGSLMISGDEASNGIALSSTEVEGQFVVSGLDAGGEETTINGESTPLVVEGVDRNVRIRMGRGDDVVRAPNLDVAGSVSVRTGMGDDVVRIGEADADEAVADIGRGLFIRLGDGDDRATVANTSARWLRINGGSGDNSIAVRDSNLTGSLTVRSRDGEDDVRLNTIDARRIALHTGAGDDSIGILSSTTPQLLVYAGFGDDAVAINESELDRTRLYGSRGTDALVTDLALEELNFRGFENVVSSAVA